MPKQTFMNLPAGKREPILASALAEFSSHSYESASINVVCREAGIPKGSFYQYFEDKKDLYRYILKMMIEKKMTYITPMLQQPFDHGFFEVIREMNLAGLKFAKDHPSYTVIGNRLLKNTRTEMYQELIKENEGQAYAVYEHLLRKAIETGEVRADIDVSFTAKIIFKLSAELVENEFDLDDPNWDTKLIDILDQFMKLIMVGISNSSQEN